MIKENKDIIVGLDIGTSKIVTVVARNHRIPPSQRELP